MDRWRTGRAQSVECRDRSVEFGQDGGMDPELAGHLDAVDAAVLGSRIKAARLSAGLTQPALGGADASVTFISRIERGERRPSVRLLETLATRLGVAVSELVLGFDRVDPRALELELDYAELELAGGQAADATMRTERLRADPTLATFPELVARARYVHATCLDALGDGGAVELFDELVATSADPSLRTRSAIALSRIHREGGDLEAARAVAEAALAATGPGGAVVDETVRLRVTLAAAVYELGDVERAREICQEAIAEADQLSSPRALASALWNASVIDAEAGSIVRALELARRALSLLEREDGVRDIARLRTQLSTILLRADPPQVDDALHQLTLASTELGWSDATLADRVRNELVIARAHFMSDDLDDARRHATEAMAAAGSALPLIQVAGDALLGQIAWSEGDRDRARDHYVAAIQVLTGIGADREAGQLWFDLGSLLDEVGLEREAGDAYRRAATSTGLTVRSHVLRMERSRQA